MISINMIFSLKNNKRAISQYRVLALDQINDAIVLFDLNQDKALPEIRAYQELLLNYSNGVLGSEAEPYADLLKKSDVELSKTEIEQRDRAYASIQPLLQTHEWELYYRSTRWKIISEHAVSINASAHELLDRLRRHWRKGLLPNAQIPLYKESSKKVTVRKAYASKHGYVLTAKDKEFIGKFYKAYYLKKRRKGRKKTEKQVYVMMIRRRYRKNKHATLSPADYPSIHQFRYCGRAFTLPSERQKLSNGGNYNLKNRPRGKTTANQFFGPGSEVQIDATRYIVHLASKRNILRIVGTPVVYIVRDCFSHATVGLAVTLFGPSWEGALLAIENTARNKVEFCAEYGIPIEPWEWPCQGRWAKVKADRAELLGPQSLAIVKHINMTKSNTPPFRGDLKGYVEGAFPLAEDDILPWVPGASYDYDPSQRRDYRLDAVLTPYDFMRLMIRHTLKYNNVRYLEDYQMTSEMLADKVRPIPLDLWNWGIANRSGQLHQIDSNLVRSHLLPQRQGSISRDGILLNQLWYDHSDARLLELYHNEPDTRIPVTGRFDPRSVNTVQIKHETIDEWITCELRDDYKVYEGCTLEEYRDEMALKKASNEILAEERIGAEIHYQDEIEADIKVAEQKKAEYLASLEKQPTKKELLSGLNQNRKDERNSERRAASGAISQNAETITTESTEIYHPKTNIHDLLQQNLDKKQKDESNG